MDQVIFARDPGRVDRLHPLDAHRDEYRYLLATAETVTPVLTSWASHVNDYRVHTIYLDTPRGTWTRGISQVKFRLRNYNAAQDWWIELKTNVSGKVNKARRPIEVPDMDRLGLRAVSAVRYHRREFEAPDASDLRVTLDRNLQAYRPPSDAPLSQVIGAAGQPVARLERLILETKSPTPAPTWLPLPDRWRGSKSRWSVAALAGHPDIIGPSRLNHPTGVAA